MTATAERVSAPTVSVEVVGPKEARYLLRMNLHNRNVSEARVESLARDMRAGNWVMNGETIKVSESETLIDGQHRLRAIVVADVSIAMLVVRGLPDSAQETVDLGAPRMLKNILQLRGMSNASGLASSARIIWMMDRFNEPYRKHVVPSFRELESIVTSNPSLAESVLVGARVSRSVVRYAPSMSAALHFLMSKRDAMAASDFWDALINGEVDQKEPVWLLRETLLRDLRSAHRSSIEHRAAITVKAWNATRQGVQLQVLLWRRAGVASEDFPKIE